MSDSLPQSRNRIRPALTGMFVLCILAIGGGATWIALTQPATVVDAWFDTWTPVLPALGALYAALYVFAWRVETGGFRSTRGDE